MTSTWTRHPVLSGVIGFVAGALAIALAEWVAHQALGTADPGKPGSITPAMFGAVLVAWVLGAGVAAFVATAWAGRRSVVPGLVAAGVLIAGSVVTMVSFPHPVWMVVGALVLMPLAAWFGTRGPAASTR